MRKPSDEAQEQRVMAQFGPLRVEYFVTVDDFNGTPVLPGSVTDEIFGGSCHAAPGRPHAPAPNSV
jgi:hypothetical protein